MTSAHDIVEIVEGATFADCKLALPRSAEALADAVDAGKLVVLKHAFPSVPIEQIRTACARFARERASENPDIVPGETQNYFRIDIDPPKSTVKSIARTFTSFYWNTPDIGGELPLMTALAALRNQFAGLPADYAVSAPVDGYISIPRIQHYPVGGGYMQMHEDPPARQRIVVSAILSERGRDYGEGGLCVRTKDGEIVDLEGELSAGDVYLLNPSVPHGVAPIDPDVELSMNTEDGRWMMFSTLVWFRSLSGETAEGEVARVVEGAPLTPR